MIFKHFSRKQLLVFNWWCSKYLKYDAIICDGAVRSGKTLCMSLSFIFWSMGIFNNKDFALCGKTVTSLKRNLITPMLEILRINAFNIDFKVSKNIITIMRNGIANRYHLFGGKDESSAALIQGITLAGVLFDEVALMPRSFVEQALARCSINNSKFWFNCNPEHPSHWFYTEWIAKTTEKKALYLHFTLNDNPGLSDKIKKRYQNLYSGVFYDRYVLGKWCAAHGAVYPAFSYQKHVVEKIPDCSKYVISCDYGTVNPSSFGLWGYCNDIWYRVKEYYYSSRVHGIQKTDEEYAAELENLASGYNVQAVVVDPSAASFIRCIKNKNKFNVIPAKNDVINGIRVVSVALSENKFRFSCRCKDIIREFSLYKWNLNSPNDTPIKENDHAMDDMRYFATYVFQNKSSAFAAISNKRRDVNS